MIVECASAVVPLPGQTSCGDRAVVAEFPGGVLVAAVDGLGHGAEAELASSAAAQVLEAEPGAPIDELVVRCHERLRVTRGAVMTVSRFEAAGRITWVAVGNVDGYLVRAANQPSTRREAVIALGGIVGYRLPALRPRTFDLQVGDTLVLATDGIRHGFDGAASQARPVQELADEILARFASGRDDACVVVARYRGAA